MSWDGMTLLCSLQERFLKSIVLDALIQHVSILPVKGHTDSPTPMAGAAAGTTSPEISGRSGFSPSDLCDKIQCYVRSEP